MGFRLVAVARRLPRRSPKRIHKVDNVCRFRPLGAFDRPGLLLPFQQLLQRILILIFKLFWVESPDFVFTMCEARSSISLGNLSSGMSSK